jgi:DNA repair protein RecO (recombination protein O)
MLYKTRGLVLHNLKYRETSLLVTIYTAEFGIASYIENGVRSVKAKHKMALFQPLTLLDLEVFHKPNRSLHRISEAKCYFPYRQIPFDVGKSSIALFLSEILGKVLKEEEANPTLFEFLEESLQFLDGAKGNYENFHIQFLWNLAAFLGFAPGSLEEFLDQLKQAQFIGAKEIDAQILNEIIMSSYGAPFSISRMQRKEYLSGILYFYRLHIESFGELKSWEILQEVMA